MISSEIIHSWKTKYNISIPVIKYLANTYPEEKDLEIILESFSNPPSSYYLRINLVKNSGSEFLKKWNMEFPKNKATISPLPNTLKLDVLGPNKIELLKNQVYCDKFAAEAVMIGADLYLPGVTGMNGSIPSNAKVSILLSKDHLPKHLRSNHKKFHIANGISELSSKDYVKFRKGRFVKSINPLYNIVRYRNHSFFKNGFISEQKLAPNFAIMCFMFTIYRKFQDSLNSLQIYDLCAAPGHKTTALAEWGTYIGNLNQNFWNPNILAIDRSSNRLNHLNSDINRLNLKNINILSCKLENLKKNHPELLDQGDAVVFDPPCSALGNRPKLFIDENLRELEGYKKNQMRLIPYVDKLVKSGGYLMYNTCTITKEENEEIIEEFISKFDYKTCSLKKFIPEELKHLGHPAIRIGSLSNDDVKNLCRFSPILGDDNGYFIAILKKK